MNVNETDNDFSFPEITEREIACERLVFNTTEDILLAMQDSGVSYAELAKRLGKSKSHVSQILNGTRNMTLRTLADISYVIDCEIKLTIYKKWRGCIPSNYDRRSLRLYVQRSYCSC
ncbi:helix-turn-helix transcriptional regulator [Raoultella ornithinolytica]|uniref:helix-turn-helix transcriptional regulator n=1 Tax=Raoultella ornithinolytica TaxID=54291 RepID=UPI001F46251A|nr:helix-turn-helix transcriptional regulator [Raoultella ornithinolytica]UIZ73920.1 helix-turn-helix transcriptional regulator [Raoultella ornithinolytica]